jgi:hypothetical protein
LADRSARTRGLALAAALVLALGCERAERKGPSPSAAPAQSQASGRELALGEVRVGVRDGRVTVECREAARGLVVERLAREARFELFGALDAKPLTLDVQHQPLESLVAMLLADLPYRAQWRFDEKTRSHELTRLEVGEIAADGATGAAAAAAADKTKRRDMADALRQQMRELREKATAAEDQKAELAARRDERLRSEADLIEQLRSSNPEMRLEAVEGLDPEGPTLAVLVDVLKTDADPRVRQKAVQQVGEAEGYMACAALLDSLKDREPVVVLQALESLEFTCDSTVLPIVEQRCVEATDPLVQQRCAEAVDFLQ